MSKLLSYIAKYPSIVLLILTIVGALAGLSYIKSFLDTREIVRKSEVIQEASKDKQEILEEARNEQKKANSISGTDEWYTWAERMQQQD